MLKFERRGGEVEGLSGNYRMLSDEQVLNAIGIGIGQIPQGASPDGNLVAQLDASRLEDDEIRDWLRKLDIQGLVTVIWLFDREGIEIDYPLFATYFDDLWYLNDNDIWVISEDGSRVLQIDHEELFYIFHREPDHVEDGKRRRQLYFPEREADPSKIGRGYARWEVS
jgi:hypothetical protein